MADNVALAQALQALANAVANLQPPMATHGPVAPVLDAFSHDFTLDLSTRAGAAAFTASSAPLDIEWDGTSAPFPAFVIALCIGASEAQWNAANPHVILTINGPNLLTHYTALTIAQVEAARAACTDPRAIQNA